MKLPEIDPIVLNRIRSQTSQKQIMESRQAKVAGEKKERDGQNGQEQQDKRSLEKSLEILNQAMEEAERPFRFKKVQRDNMVIVQIWDTAQNRVIREVLPEKVHMMVSRVRDMMGMLMDELI